ncbi:MAG TPA: FAD-dependent oxidoreductase [Firmicutes bacterium]|nr:FAD-dependent oxidoreductase [Bacillota bacterium]
MSERSVLVLGGGVAGCAAAATLAKAGIAVHVVEAAPAPGGHAGRYGCKATDSCQRCGVCLWYGERLPAEVQVWTNSEGCAVERRNDGFQVLVRGSQAQTLFVKAVVVATGMEPFPANTLANLGYPLYPGILTTYDLERQLYGGGELAQSWPVSEVSRIAFIQCVGSRDVRLGRDYCARVCCGTSLRLAGRLRQHLPGAEIDIFYMDMQGLGKRAAARLEQAQANGIHFVRSMPSKIYRLGNGPLLVQSEDLAAKGTALREYDRVVLAVGMQASPGTAQAARWFELATGPGGFLLPGRGNETGVFAAGSCLGPLTIAEAISSGRSAARQVLHYFGCPAPAGSVLVLGGDEAGLAAARHLANRGAAVIMVAQDRGDSHPGIIWRTDDRLLALTGSIGHFRATLTNGQVDVAAVVVAPGAGREISLVGDKIADLRDEDLVALVQAVPLEQELVIWLPESVSPMARGEFALALRAARLGRQRGLPVWVLTEQAPVAGLAEQYDEVRALGAVFLRYQREPEWDAETGTLLVEDPALPGATLTIAPGLLLMGGRWRPHPDNEALANVLGVGLDEDGYLQDDNVHRNDVFSRRKGVFLAGLGRGAVAESDLAAEGKVAAEAVWHALQWLQDQPVAVVDPEHCAYCLTCYRSCPHGAVGFDDQLPAVRIDPRACWGCATCVARCPGQAIALQEEGIG